MARREHFRAIVLPSFVAGFGLFSLVAVCLLMVWLSAGLGEALTRNTVRVTLFWYGWSLLLMMRMRQADWRVETTMGQVARWCWTWGILSFLVHLGMAFHFYDNWSHAQAFERTRQVSGVGEGLYVSYVFTLGWLADALWWWLAPVSYAERPRWIGSVWHGFMALIFFNGTVVFETGPIRWIGLTMLVFLVGAWFAGKKPLSSTGNS